MNNYGTFKLGTYTTYHAQIKRKRSHGLEMSSAGGRKVLEAKGKGRKTLSFNAKSLLRSLPGRRDFELVFKEGVSLASQHLVIYARLNQLSVHRLGLSVSRKLGNAVLRNRIKRLLKESMRKVFEEIPLSADFVIIARKSSQRETG
jgi:ribonuclease P protein component